MLEISDSALSLRSSVQDALQVINHSNAQIAFVVNDSNVLVGTITDGDIRRGLLAGHLLKSKASVLMNKNFLLW